MKVWAIPDTKVCGVTLTVSLGSQRVGGVQKFTPTWQPGGRLNARASGEYEYYVTHRRDRAANQRVGSAACRGRRTAFLAHTSNQVFIDVVRELRQLGVGNKVIADMFGMALRTYHDRVKRLEQEARYGGCSLWEAVLAYIRAEQPVTQAELLTRFRKEDSLTLRGVIKDLADNGHVSRTGRGLNMTYRVASEFPEEGASSALDRWGYGRASRREFGLGGGKPRRAVHVLANLRAGAVARSRIAHGARAARSGG